MKISVNAPSYKRAHDVKVLSYLPFCKIWVDEAEFDEYKRANPGAEIVSCAKGIQGNLCRVRNHILRTEFKDGADVVLIIDDDFICLERFEVNKETEHGYEKRKITADEFLPFLEKYSQMAADIGAKFWGVNCNVDARSFVHYTPFSTVSYIGGPFQCFLKGNRCWYDENLPLKEDYDMTLQQCNLERVVFRLNGYHYYCDQSKSPGGCASYRNREREKQQFEALQKKWGDKIVQRDSGGKDRNRTKERIWDDYNPIIRIPIRGV